VSVPSEPVGISQRFLNIWIWLVKYYRLDYSFASRTELRFGLWFLDNCGSRFGSAHRSADRFGSRFCEWSGSWFGSVRKLADRGYPQRTASLKMSFKTLLWLHFWKIENNLLNCIALCFFNLVLILFFDHKIKFSQSVYDNLNLLTWL
jgi:hypothetical protein